MTREEAMALAETRWWESATDEQIVALQLYEDRLCMDFGVFHEAVERVLGRPVFTDEFAQPDRLQAEFEGKRERPTFEEILAQLPANVQKIFVVLP
jgi:hypothetical protein